MSIQSVSGICSRIKAAQPNQPIRVFVVQVNDPETGRPRPALNAVFAKTYMGQMMRLVVKPAHSSSPRKFDHIYDWVGDFHNHMNLRNVRNFLLSLVKEEEEQDEE